MAIKPAINPGVAVAERPATLSGAMNFISGGQTLGTSIVASAANKIVGFQRGAAAVAPKSPDLGSIISTLSTNILSNVENKLQSVNQNIQQVIQNKFLSQLGDYRNRIQEITSNPPSKILQNFLSLYKEALGYIRFLGDRRNIKRLGENLQALQNVFSETFKIAALVRTTIVKIVRQLSNLPTASGGPGGLNLDINVPGAPLRRAGRLSNVVKMAGIGAAAAGAGALGSRVVSGMMDIGGDVQPDTTGVVSSIPAPLLDRFMEILNRFDKALQGFQVPKQSPSAPGAPSGTKPGDGPGAGPGAGPTAGGNYGSAGAEAVKNFAATQGYSPEFTAGLLSTIEKESGFNPYAIGDSGNSYGLFQFNQAAGRRQPFLDFLEQGGVKNPQELFLNPNSERAKKEKDKVFNLTLEYMMQREQGSQIARDYSKSKDLRTIMGGFEDIERYSGSQPGLARNQRNNPKYNERLQRAQGYLQSGVVGKPIKATGGPGEDAQKLEAQIRASTDRSQGMKGIAGDVSKPAISKDQQSNVSIVPLVMGSPQSNSTPSGSQVRLPPVMSKGGATVPFLSSSNEDNFFTILSKVVYNIVDG